MWTWVYLFQGYSGTGQFISPVRKEIHKTRMARGKKW